MTRLGASIDDLCREPLIVPLLALAADIAARVQQGHTPMRKRGEHKMLKHGSR